MRSGWAASLLDLVGVVAQAIADAIRPKPAEPSPPAPQDPAGDFASIDARVDAEIARRAAAAKGKA